MKNTDQDMMQEIFDNCLDILHSGGSLSDCLSLYPEHAKELESMLKDVQMVSSTFNQIEPIPTHKAHIQYNVMQALNKDRRASSSFFNRIFRRPAIALAISFVLVLIIGGGGLTAMSKEAMPDSWLYNVKRISENVSMTFSFGYDNKAKQAYKMAERRAMETGYLLFIGQHSEALEMLQEFKKEYYALECYNKGLTPDKLKNYDDYKPILDSRYYGTDLEYYIHSAMAMSASDPRFIDKDHEDLLKIHSQLKSILPAR